MQPPKLGAREEERGGLGIAMHAWDGKHLDICAEGHLDIAAGQGFVRNAGPSASVHFKRESPDQTHTAEISVAARRTGSFSTGSMLPRRLR
jgi:hypothetical protein